MPIISGAEAVRIASALALAGAKWTPYWREKKDANGVAVGLPVRMGCMLGMTYIKGQTSNLRIEVPGVIIGQDVTRFEGVLANGCGMPRSGDILCIDGTTGERAKITNVSSEAAPFVVLTLDR